MCTRVTTRTVQGSSVIRQKSVARNRGQDSGGKDFLGVRALGRRGDEVYLETWRSHRFKVCQGIDYS